MKRITNKRVWLRLLGWALLCYAVATFSGIVTSSEIAGWYQTLNKPSFSPPNWVFAPVWTLLYIAITLAIWLAVELPQQVEKVQQRDTRKFALQVGAILMLIGNGLWSQFFFGWHNLEGAFAVLVGLIVVSLWLLKAFWGRNTYSFWLFFPYVCWISFAAVLNGAIIRINS
ncbi:TspO/MBR family protein [Polycladidibacter stylochi]|uniref:TspO/MBR family protein n=1 Tax=Polycladidibacter stylochi TaxID=1807766 RepID=UPI0008300997|nr:TspO/MBR family protein [Pseudovibrio stylochi]